MFPELLLDKDCGRGWYLAQRATEGWRNEELCGRHTSKIQKETKELVFIMA